MDVKNKNEQYLLKLFSLMREREGIAIQDKNTHFKSTELRMLNEILLAKYNGERLISAEISRRLGITRSAVSQIVNDLEKRKVIVRLPDSIDKKIAYIEIADGVLETYREDIEKAGTFASKLIAQFGEEKFNQMYALFTEFSAFTREKIKSQKK